MGEKNIRGGSAVILPKLRGESTKRRKELIFKKEIATFGAKSNNWVVGKNCIYHVYNESTTVCVDLLVYRESQTGRRWPALSNRVEKQYHYRYYPALYYTKASPSGQWPLFYDDGGGRTMSSRVETLWPQSALVRISSRAKSWSLPSRAGAQAYHNLSQAYSIHKVQIKHIQSTNQRRKYD